MMPILIIQAATAILVMFSTLYLLARIAPALDLVDVPSARKTHSGSVPLVGGLSLYITFVFCIIFWPHEILGTFATDTEYGAYFLMICMGLLVSCGAADDRNSIGLATRIIFELLVAAALASLLDLRVINLGDILGWGDIILSPSMSYIFTAIAIFGVINAINMFDGLDGLAAIIMLSALLFFQISYANGLSPAVVIISACLSVFLVSNLGLFNGVPKTFLGDAGSRLLGLTAACLLLTVASSRVGGAKIIDPTTALYMIALPLFDMVFTVMRRILEGQSPFQPDRTHIHHLLLKLGHSKRSTLLYLVLSNLAFNAIGLYFHKTSTHEHYQFATFCLGFIIYYVAIHRVWSHANNKHAADEHRQDDHQAH